MAIRYVRADITTLKIDAIVNSANPLPVIGSGCDSAIYEAAGAERLLKERKKIGTIEIGDAMATSGFDLCKTIIHTVGPDWVDGSHGEFEDLRSCYRNSLKLVLQEQCRSVAFPLISTGVYGFPKDEALRIATEEINAFLLKHSHIQVILCIFDEDSFVLSGKIAESVEEFITREKAKKTLQDEYGVFYDAVMERGKQARLQKPKRKTNASNRYELSEEETPFHQKLKYYVDLSGEKASAIYGRAWLPRRTYSRIMKGNYVPHKDAVLALCIALKLSAEKTADLLARNGQAFNPADKWDQFVFICIRNKTFDLEKINEGLVKIGLDDRTFLDRRDLL